MRRDEHGGRIDGAGAGPLLDYSANANAWQPPIPKRLWARWKEEMKRYPSPDARAARVRLADVHGVPQARLLPTAGGIEGIYLVARLLAPRRVAIVEPAFADYRRALLAAGAARIEPVILPPEDWHGPITRWSDRVAGCDAVFLGNPNNPTGAFHPAASLLELVRSRAGRARAWVVDEAFAEFAGPDRDVSLLGALDRCPNLIVIRSLTKAWAVPGLRVGFVASANRAWLTRLEEMQPPWALGRAAECWVRDCVTRAARTRMQARLATCLPPARARFRAAIDALPGLRALPSAANYFLIETAHGRAKRIATGLAARGVAVRRCDSFLGMQPGCHLRLAIRTHRENRQVLAALAGTHAEEAG